MTASWDSLYLPSADQAAAAAVLRQSLEGLGYTLYDPFGLLPGRSYAHMVRLFVTPPDTGWLRVIGTPDPRLLPLLSQTVPCLHLSLNDTTATIEFYMDGSAQPPETGLSAHLRADRTPDDLNRALSGELASADDSAHSFAYLPEDIQPLAGQVDSGQAQKMFNRLSGNLLKKTGADAKTADAARELLQPPDWASPGARRLLALAGCITLPRNWREPDFVTLRDAYQLHARRQRKPDARLYPGDDEIMARVPDALDYIPIYGGRDD